MVADIFSVDAPIAHSRPWITASDRAAVTKVLRTGLVAHGAAVAGFEGATARYLGVQHAFATASGTVALTLALLSLDLERGGDVVIPTYVCRAVADAVLTAGLRPVLCDVGDDWTLTADSVQAALTADTRAIIAVHTFGALADIDALRVFGLPIIEDACMAFGLRAGQLAAGACADLGVVSFHGTKCLTTGEGGAVVTSRPDLAQRLAALQPDGPAPARYVGPPMSDIQAALGLSQLRRYDEFLQRRQTIARHYLDELTDLDISLPHQVRDRSMFFRFPVRASGAFDVTRERFERFGVRVRRGVDTLLHDALPRHLLDARRSFPRAEAAFAETVSLPIYPSLTRREQSRVIRAARAVWGRAAS